METFTPARTFSSHPNYITDRKKAQGDLVEEIRKGSIDRPLLSLVRECIPIPYCFTVQCCFGHFVHEREPDPGNLVLPSLYRGTIASVRYRLAYFVVCLQDSHQGRKMYADLQALATMNPAFTQFGSADWFWERTVNTYCIQLVPDRIKTEDSGIIPMEEALVLEELRAVFFHRLAGIVHNHRADPPRLAGV